MVEKSAALTKNMPYVRFQIKCLGFAIGKMNMDEYCPVSNTQRVSHLVCLWLFSIFFVFELLCLFYQCNSGAGVRAIVICILFLFYFMLLLCH